MENEELEKCTLEMNKILTDMMKVQLAMKVLSGDFEQKMREYEYLLRKNKVIE